VIPLLRGGEGAPYKNMSRYLKQGAAGEVSDFCNKRLTSPAAPILLGSATYEIGAAAPPRRRGY